MLNDLEALLPSLSQHMPEIASDVITLVSELRMISSRGFTPPRRLLDIDLPNLTEGLAGVCDFRAAGVSNTDVDDAEAAMKTLLLDMRKRASDTIRERSGMLKIHAEVAAGRADTDIQARDLTDSYRLMVAQPVTVLPKDVDMVVSEVGLPEIGGPTGRVIGDFLYAECNAEEAYAAGDEAAPLDTAYLPPGSSLKLRKGEQVILRVQGGIAGEGEFSIQNFLKKGKDVQIEAVGDDVMIYGPATLSAYNGTPLSDLSVAGKEMGAIVKKTSVLNKITFSDEATALIGVPVMAGSMVCSFIAFDVGNPLWGTGLLGLMSASIGMMWRNMARDSGGNLKYCKMKEISSVSRDAILFGMKRLLGREMPSCGDRTLKFYKNTCQFFEKNIKGEKFFRFYPVRKIVTPTDQSVKVIRPLAALAHHQDVPAADLSSQPKKVHA